MARSAVVRGVATPAEHNAALGEVGPGQFGSGGRVLGPAPRLFDRGGGDHAGGRAHAPPRGGEAVTLGSDDHEVVAGQREIDGLLPAVHPDGAPDQGVEHRFGDRPALAHPHVASHRLGAAARGQLARPGRARGLPGRQDRPGDAALAQGGEGRLGRAPSVDHHGGDSGPDGGLEGGLPAVVDLDQVDQRADDAVDVAQQLAPTRALQVRQRAFEGLGPGCRAVARLLGLVRRHLCRLGVAGRFLERRRAHRQLGLERGGRLVQLVCLPGHEIGAHGGAGGPLLQRAHARPEHVHVLLLACGGAGQRLRAGAHLSEGLVGRVGVVPEHGGPAPPQRPRLLVQAGHGEVELRPFRRGAGLLFRLGRDELAGQARRLGLERRDHVDVGRGIEGGHDPPAPLAQHAGQPARPLHQALHAAQGVGQVLLAARRQFRRGGGGLGIELLEGRVQLDLLVTADGQVLHGRQAPGAQLGLLGPGEIPAHRKELGRHAVVRAGRRRLALERPDLASDLAHQISQALQVLGRPRQSALGPLAAAAVLQHARRLLNDGPPVLRPGVQYGVELALADDHVLLAAHTGVAEQLLNVQEPARGAVDGVLAVAGAEERPGDGDLGQIDRQLARRVVDGERDLGPAQLGSRGGAGENDVLHFRRAERAGPLGAEHPGHGVDDVGLAAPVRADHHRHPGLELQHRRVREGLETLHAERLQEHRGDPIGGLRVAEGSHLAVFAEEGRATAGLHPHDGVAAAAAGLALAVVDLV